MHSPPTISGPRVAVVDRLLECLNAGLQPGDSAEGIGRCLRDLAPLAHLAAAICGFPRRRWFIAAGDAGRARH